MNQLEDDLHRVLQLARAQSRLSRPGHASSARPQLQHSSRRHHAVQRHRHERGDLRERHRRSSATLLDAKLRGISAVYGLARNIPKLGESSALAVQVHTEVARASSGEKDSDQHECALEARLAARRDLYKRHFSGLRGACGPSGLPKLECLLDAAQLEKKKMARHSALAVGASVLTSGNRIYASCAIEGLHDAKFSMCAERAVLLKVLGEDSGEVVVAMAICSDVQEVLPYPCGGCREFMAEFGDFPVYLVNEHLESEETRSFALFPRARQSSTTKVLQQQNLDVQQAEHKQRALHQSREQSDHHRLSISGESEKNRRDEPLSLNVRDWTGEHVLDWLRDDVELPQYRNIFKRSAVDGCTLLHLEDCDLQLLLGILQPLHRRRILLHIDRLKDRELLEHGIDYGQLQDYLAVLDRDRIAIVAELKSTFDRLDQNKDGFLDFRQVRQALSALHCDASPQVVDALLRGKLLGGDSQAEVSFSDFVGAFSSLAMQPAADQSSEQAQASAAWQLPVLDIRGLRGTFDKADANKSGGIDEQELAQLFLGLDATKSKDECARKARKWFEAADTNGDGRLNFAEFLVRYIQLKQVDVGKLRAFFESREPVESAELKPVGVLMRALETFFVDCSSVEISVWYKRHLNSELLRVVKDARTSLTISYADFILAVFLFQDHMRDHREQTRELRAKMSNDALAHKSRVVHLQQSGHVRMCPQSNEAPGASEAAASHKSLSLAEIRRNQQKQRLQALQRQQERESEDEGKAGSDPEHGNIAAIAKQQKRHLARLLEKVDATFDRFARAKAVKKKRTGASSSSTKRRTVARGSDEDEKKCDSSNDSDSRDHGELNAMETAQALTELGISCPRERTLRLLKDEGFGIHDSVDRRDFRRLFQHFYAENETTLGSFPNHRHHASSIWNEEVEHAKQMQEMAALLSGEYGKHPTRQDYDEYLLQRRRQIGEGFEIGDRVVSADDGYGTLIRLHQDYFVADVHFDSGKKTKNVDLSKLKRANSLDEQAALRRHQQRAPSFHVGMRVAVSFKGTKTAREGKIAVCRLDGTFDVFVNKLGERETLKRVPAKHLRALSSKPTVYALGASVTVKQKHAYLRGKVHVCRVDGSYDICLRQDKSILKRVEVDLIFPDDDDGEDESDREEDSRDNRAAGKKSTFRGKRGATSDSEQETKNGADDDGGYDDFEPEFAKGDRVEVRFQGKDAFYPGKISRALTDGTYDIAYDDGDSETRVKSHLIRLLKSTSSGSNSQSKAGRAVKDGDYEDDFE